MGRPGTKLTTWECSGCLMDTSSGRSRLNHHYANLHMRGAFYFPISAQPMETWPDQATPTQIHLSQ